MKILDELTARGQLELSLRTILGHHAERTTVEKAVQALVEENRMLYRWNMELRQRVVTVHEPMALGLTDADTRGT